MCVVIKMSVQTIINKLQSNLEQLINGAVLLVGIILILSSMICEKGGQWETILISIGASLIASAIVSFLTSIYILKYQRAKNIAETWGIRSIEEQRALMNVQVDERMRKAKKHIDIIAYGLKSLRESGTRLIKDALKRNIRIRIITVNPENEILRIKDKDEGKSEGSTAQSINKLEEWVKHLNEGSKGKIELRFCETLPSELYYRVDKYVYTGPYQFGRESQRTITTEYKSPGKGYSYYTQYFDDLWNDENFCS